MRYLLICFILYNNFGFAQPDRELLKQGDEAYQKNDYQQSIKFYDKAILANPKNEIAYNNRGWSYYLLGNPKQAVLDIQKAIEIDSIYAIARKNLAFIQLEMKDLENSLKNINRVIPDLGDDSFAFQIRGRIYIEKKNYSKAIEDLNQAIKLDNQIPESYLYRGFAYMSDKKYETAIKDFNELIRLVPNYHAAYNNRGFCYMNLNNITEAKKDFDKALIINVKDVNALNNRAAIFKKMGNLDKACVDWKYSMSLGNETARKFYEENCLKNAPTAKTLVALDSVEIKDKATLEITLLTKIRASDLKLGSSLKIGAVKGKEGAVLIVNAKTPEIKVNLWTVGATKKLNVSLSSVLDKPGIYDAFIEYVTDNNIPKVLNFKLKVKKLQ